MLLLARNTVCVLFNSHTASGNYISFYSTAEEGKFGELSFVLSFIWLLKCDQHSLGAGDTGKNRPSSLPPHGANGTHSWDFHGLPVLEALKPNTTSVI